MIALRRILRDQNALSRAEISIRVLVAVALSGAVIVLSRFPHDDAFIHMRIARNLASGGGPFFNAGERVMGGSSPLWMLIVSGLFRVTKHDTLGLIVALECVLIVALWIATEAWLALSAGGRSLWTGVLSLALVTGLVLPSAGFLMEAPLALLLAVIGALALVRGRPAAGGVALGLAVAARYEMGLLVAVSWLASPNFRSRAGFLAGLLPGTNRRSHLPLALLPYTHPEHDTR